MKMQTDLLPIERNETLKQRRPWYILAVVLLMLTVPFQQPLFFLAALFSFLIGIVPNLWYRLALRHLIVRQQVSHHHLFFGEEVTLSLSIENHKLLPLPWLRVENKII